MRTLNDEALLCGLLITVALLVFCIPGIALCFSPFGRCGVVYV
jgi:uncharacterized protein YybS (DUF2232 family)